MPELTNKDSEISEVYKPIYYWIATVFCRLWLTIIIAVTGLIWLAEGKALLIMTSIALLIDLVRNFKAPELISNINQIENDFNRTYREEKNIKRLYTKYNIVSAILLFAPVILTAVIIYLDYTFPSMFFDNKVWIIELYKILSPYFKFMISHVEQITELGYEDRIPAMLFVYIVVVITTFIAMSISLFGFTYNSSIVYSMKDVRYKYSEDVSVDKPYLLSKPHAGTIVIFLMYATFCTSVYLFSIRGAEESTYPYNIYESNLPFLTFSLVFSAIFNTASIAYVGAIRMRLDACGIWQKLINPKRYEIN